MRHLLIKDMRVLKRSPLLIGLLIVYPAVVAVLAGLALSSAPTQPRIAVYNAVPSYDSEALIGGKDFNIDDVLKPIYDGIEENEVDSRAEAIEAVRSGDAVAAIVIPRNLPNQLEDLGGSVYVETIFDGSDPVRRQYVQTTIEGLLADANRDLTKRFKGVALDYLDIVVNGGKIMIGGRSVELLGLAKIEKLLPSISPNLAPADRARVEAFSRSAGVAQNGLGYANDLLDRIGEPVKVRERPLKSGPTVSSYAASIAVTVSLMFIALLIGSGMLALEREENVLPRLVRGLVSRTKLIGEKSLLAALCSSIVASVMLGGLAALISLRWERAPVWLLAVVLAGVAFGAAGVAIGAIARDIRAASLLAFMLGLPLAIVGLVPRGSVSNSIYGVLNVISATFPFKPALRTLEGALDPAQQMLWPALHLCLLALIFAVVAHVGLRRH